MANEGKTLEKNFREGFSDERVLRLYDTTNGFKGVANPCDFVVFGDSKTILVECKSVKGTRLPFDNITECQWDGLSRYRSKSVISGILVEFREVRRVYFVDIYTLQDILSQGVKSINVHECERRALPVDVNYKRTNFEHDGYSFIIKCERFFRYSDEIH